ncbi:MAG: hypothetical protein LW860_00035 [Xanthomonadaceae bacterium]|nr:hypothetical protein [Xanthomonadaceae bacterium]
MSARPSALPEPSATSPSAPRRPARPFKSADGGGRFGDAQFPARRLFELAAAWEREAYQHDARLSRTARTSQLSDFERRLTEMHARVLRASAGDLRRLIEGGGMPDRG